MEAFFTRLLEMSLAGGFFVAALLLTRPLIRKIPAFMRCILWAMVGIRLICPFEIKTGFSLVPDSFVLKNKITTFTGTTPPGQEYISRISAMPGGSVLSGKSEIMFSDITLMQAVIIIWLSGLAVLSTYYIVSYVKIKRQSAQSIRIENNIYKADEVFTPFIIGIIRPKVIIPSGLDTETASYAIIHEKMHLKRLDHVWKLLSFFVLAVHWFNPLIWIAFRLFDNDIEAACDEKVIKTMTKPGIAAYSKSLLICASGKRSVFTVPSFSGAVIKRRIINILDYKEPGRSVILLSALFFIALALLFMTGPLNSDLTIEDSAASTAQIQQGAVDSFSQDSEFNKESYFQITENRDGRGNLTDTSKCIYNKNGVLTKRLIYDADGNLVSSREYQTDESGFADGIREYDANGNIVSTAKYTRDSEGRELSCKAEYADGSFCWWNEYSYDAKGNATGYTRFNEDGSIMYTWQSIFSENGLEKRRICRDSNGDKLWTQNFTYSADGSLLKTEEFAADGSLTSVTDYSGLSAIG